MQKGQQVIFFYESNASDCEAPLAYCGKSRGGGFVFAGSHVWLRLDMAQSYALLCFHLLVT